MVAGVYFWVYIPKIHLKNRGSRLADTNPCFLFNRKEDCFCLSALSIKPHLIFGALQMCTNQSQENRTDGGNINKTSKTIGKEP